MNLELYKGRKCNACTACCTLLGVPELGKPAGQSCMHCNTGGGGGCRVYAHRPQSCQDFHCAWRLGLFTDSDRPDKIDVLFWFQQGTKIQDAPLLTVQPLDQHALREGRRGDALVQQESRGQLVLIVDKTQRRLVGPQAMVEAAAVKLQEILKNSQSSNNG